MRHRLALAALVAMAACSEPTSVSNGAVVAKREGESLTLHNRSDAPRAYLATDRDMMTLASMSSLDLIALCTTTDATCLRLQPGETVVLPLTEIAGYSSATKAVIVWTWRVLPASGGQNQAVMDPTIELVF